MIKILVWYKFINRVVFSIIKPIFEKKMIFQTHNFKISHFDKYSKNIKLFKFKMDLN